MALHGKLANKKLHSALIILLLFATHSHGQVSKKFSVAYTDSIELAENEQILGNAVRITKTVPENVEIGVRLQFPSAWRVLKNVNADDLECITLPDKEVTIIPINILKTSKVHADWDSIRIKIWTCNSTDTSYYFARIKVKARPGFNVQRLDDYQNINDTMRPVIVVRSRIQNTGNIEDQYSITCNSPSLGISKSLKIKLPPGKDTILEITTNIKPGRWKHIQKETILYKVEGAKMDKPVNLAYTVNRLSSSISQSSSLFRHFPIVIGGGVMTNDERTTYFGTARGNLKFGDHTLNFNYRSKDFGYLSNSYQTHVFFVGYNYKGFRLEGGRVAGPKNFITTGQGATIGYSGKNLRVFASGLKYIDLANQNETFKNNNLYGGISYNINKSVIQHNLETNFNEFYGVHSYLLANEATLIDNKQTELSIRGGLGYEHMVNKPPGQHQEQIGFNLGYKLQSTYKKWHIRSRINYNSSGFPGIYKGNHFQNHQLRYYYRTDFYVGGLLHYNSIERNILRDTIYNSDYLSVNNIRYGLTAGKAKGKATYNISMGFIDRTSTSRGIKNGNFADGNLRLRMNNHSELSMGAIYALKIDDGKFISSINAKMRFQTRRFSLSGFYNKIPTYNESNEVTSFRETVRGGPSVNFNLFNRTLGGSFRYTIGKTISQEALRHGFGGHLNYSNEKNGLTIALYGFYPLKDPSHLNVPLTETRYASLTLTKALEVPYRRLRLYDIKTVMYRDENNNNTMDEHEERLANARVSIDDHTFITNSKGEAMYRNMKPATYSISFANATTNGLVASNGVEQTVDLSKDIEIQIPFKQGLKLHGNVQIELDSLSNTVLTPDNLKVTAKDTFGRHYTSLTDASGDFYMYVPQGVYEVSLNPEAFKGTAFKPERISFQVDMYSQEDAFVQFNIRQKRRQIRFVEPDKKIVK